MQKYRPKSFSSSFAKERQKEQKAAKKKENSWRGATFKRFSYPSAFNESEEVKLYAERVDAAWKKTVEGIVEAGQVLKEAKEKLGYGKYGAMLRKLRLHERIAEMLMIIADNQVIKNPKNFSALPARYTSLYRLCVLPDDKLQELIDNGEIWRSMRGEDVKALTFKSLDRLPSVFKGIVAIMDEYPGDGEENALECLAMALKQQFEKDTLTPFQRMSEAAAWCKKFSEIWKKLEAEAQAAFAASLGEEAKWLLDEEDNDFDELETYADEVEDDATIEDSEEELTKVSTDKPVPIVKTCVVAGSFFPDYGGYDKPVSEEEEQTKVDADEPIVKKKTTTKKSAAAKTKTVKKRNGKAKRAAA